MRHLSLAAIWIAILFFALPVPAQWIPHSVSYQGQLNDGGTPYDGNAAFKFALVRTSDDVTVWSNDGTSSNGEEPDGSVLSTVVQGMFRLQLGGEQDMPPITPDVLDQDSELVLRMWVEIGNGFEPMSDQSIDGGFFAAMAACATGSCGDFVVSGQLDVSGEIVAGSGVRLPDGNLLTGVGQGGGSAGWTVSGDDVTSSVAGNVGIGTAAPSAKLHVEGDTFRLGSAKYSNGTPSGRAIISTDGVHTDLIPATDEAGRVRVLDGNSSTGLAFESSGRGGIQFFTDVSNSTPGHLLLQYRGGYLGVGIGTDPIAGLHVRNVIQFGDDPTVSKNFHLGSGFWNNQDAFRFWNGNNGSGSLLMTMLPTGEVGIGTDNPQAKLDVRGDLRAQNPQGVATVAISAQENGDATEGAALSLYNEAGFRTILLDADVRRGTFPLQSSSNSPSLLMHNADGSPAVIIHAQQSTSATSGSSLALYDGAGNPTIQLDARDSGGNGRVITQVLEITGGADLSEQFDVQPSSDLQPGYVVSIDPSNPGGLVVSRRAYDRAVAGVISGAGGVRPGMLMGQRGSVADGSRPVALTGRVYCWADASYGSIVPGDQLTTSNTSGHAMRVDDPDVARGAIIGKAMSSLTQGKGLVLVLVNLH